MAAGKFFTVAVIDSRPRYEGRQMAQVLDELGVPVEYGLVNGANYLMQGATKVYVGRCDGGWNERRNKPALFCATSLWL